MTEAGKINAFLVVKSHGAAVIFQLSALAFVKVQKSRHVHFHCSPKKLQSLKQNDNLGRDHSCFKRRLVKGGVSSATFLAGNGSVSQHHRRIGLPGMV